MKADTLKKSILQWAIEGKLVPQLESEPEVEQIGEKPEDVPFDIPEKWKWVFLKSLVQPAKQKKPDRDFIYVDVSSIDNKNHEISNAKFIEAHNAPSRARKIIEEGMVLYATVRPYLKNICIAQQNAIKESIASTAFACMKCKDPLLNKYLLAVLISPWADQYMTSVQKGVAYPAVSDKDFYELLVPLPPIDEQIRICASLDQMKVLINSYEQEQIKLEKLEKEFSGKLKSSILQEAIQGKLVPQLESEPEVVQIGEVPENVPFAIPQKWKWVPVNKIIELISGRDLDKSLIEEKASSSSVPYITGASQISNNDVLVNRWTNNGSVFSNTGDLLLTCKGTVGKLAINQIGICHIARQIMAIRPKDQISGDFAKIFFSAIGNKLTSNAKSMIPGISRNDVLSLLCPLPPIEEQHRIVAKLNELLDSVKHLEYNVSKT